MTQIANDQMNAISEQGLYAGCGICLPDHRQSNDNLVVALSTIRPKGNVVSKKGALAVHNAHDNPCRSERSVMDIRPSY